MICLVNWAFFVCLRRISVHYTHVRLLILLFLGNLFHSMFDLLVWKTFCCLFINYWERNEVVGRSIGLWGLGRIFVYSWSGFLANKMRWNFLLKCVAQTNAIISRKWQKLMIVLKWFSKNCVKSTNISNGSLYRKLKDFLRRINLESFSQYPRKICLNHRIYQVKSF